MFELGDIVVVAGGKLGGDEAIVVKKHVNVQPAVGGTVYDFSVRSRRGGVSYLPRGFYLLAPGLDRAQG